MKAIGQQNNGKPGIIGGLNLLTLDLIFPGLPKIPEMGEEATTNAFEICLGGGPVAALAVAGRLGAQTRLATHIGNDVMSELARQLLEKEQVGYQEFTPGQSTNPSVNISSVLTFENDDRSFVSYFVKSDWNETALDEKYEYLKEAGLCIASSPSLDLFGRLNKAGCRIVYDVGWDDGMDIASLRPVLEHVYLFTPNSKEAMKLTGAESPESALRQLAKYVKYPVVKLGKDGALVLQDDAVLHLPSAAFHAVDATGAGDAFLGGVSYGLLQGWNIVDCVELGNFTGGTATTAIGCLTAKCTLEDYYRYQATRQPERRIAL